MNQEFPARGIWRVYKSLTEKDGKLFADWNSWRCFIDTNPMRFENPEGDGEEIVGEKKALFDKTRDERLLLCEMNKEQFFQVKDNLDQLRSMGVTEWKPNEIQEWGAREFGLREEGFYDSRDPKIVIQKYRNELGALSEGLIGWFITNGFPIPSVPSPGASPNDAATSAKVKWSGNKSEFCRMIQKEYEENPGRYSSLRDATFKLYNQYEFAFPDWTEHDCYELVRKA